MPTIGAPTGSAAASPAARSSRWPRSTGSRWSASPTGDSVWWSSRSSSDEPDPGIYHGVAGIVLALLEAHAHFGDQRWADLALRGTRWLTSAVDAEEYAPYPSLYAGLAGMALALHEAAGYFDDDAARAASLRALARVRSGFDGERWGDPFELLSGNAGIALAALRVGDTDLAATAVTPYLRTAETTATACTGSLGAGTPPGCTTSPMAPSASPTRSPRPGRRSAAATCPTRPWPGSPTSPPAMRRARTASWSRTPTRSRSRPGLSGTPTAGATARRATRRSSGSSRS